MSKKILAASLCVALTGCAGLIPKKPEPKFDPAVSAAEQAPTFISANKFAKLLGDKKKVFISECIMMVGETTSAGSDSSGGLFPESDKVRRDVSVRSIYYLKGIDEARLQAMTDGFCADAEKTLAEAGYEVVPRSSLLADPKFVEMTSNGKPSPYVFGVGQTQYKVFAPGKANVFNPSILGMGAGLSMAFKQASGASPWFKEAWLADQLDAHAVRYKVLLDFSNLQSNNSKWDKWAKKDSAEVKAKVGFTVNGSIDILPRDTVKCYNRFGRECAGNGKVASFALKKALSSEEKFYTEIKDATTTGDKVGGAISTAVSILAMAGGQNSRSFSITRTNVTVDPDAYEGLAKRYAGYFLQMAMASAKSGS